MNKLEECMKIVKEEATKKKIKNKKTGEVFVYGQNPFADMEIMNCVYVDFYPDKVKNKQDFFGFNRDKWEVENITD